MKNAIFETHAERAFGDNHKQPVSPGRAHDGGVPSHGRDGESVAYAFESFMLHTRAKRLTRKTQRFYRSQLAPFAAYCQDHGHDRLAAITPALIRAYLIALEERGLSDYSVHAAARSIRAFLNFCVQEGYFNVSPMANVAMPRVNRRILPAFSEEDVRRLLSVCQTTWDTAIILFLLDTGCRAAELTNLDGRDVDLALGEVRIRRGKGQRDRSVFLGQRALTQLAKYYEEVGEPEDHQPV